jgi:hypothetical protein
MKKKLVTLIGLVLVLALAATPVFAADPDPGRGNTDVVVMNMGTTATDATAIYYNTNGSPEYNAPTNLASRGSYRFAASAATPLGDNWRGSMTVQSAGEVAAVAEILWTNGNSVDGQTADAYTGFPTGATTMYVPYAVYSVNSQFTQFAVQNTEGSQANIRLTFINRTGTTDLQTNDTIPALGSKNYDVRSFNQLQSTTFWQNNCAAGQCFWSGAVKVESTNGKKIAAAATNHWVNWAAAYSAVASGATRIYVPSVERRCTNCAWNPAPPNADQYWQGLSVVTVQCLSTTTPCEVDMQFVGQTSNMANLTLPTKTLNPGAAVAASTRAGNDYPQALFNQLRRDTDPANQASWAGSVIVSTRNNTDVAVVAYNQRPTDAISVGFSGAGSATAGQQTFLPTIYKRGVCDGGFNWQRFSIIRIQNPTNNNATDVDIYYYNRNGTLAAQELNRNIPAGQALTRHTRVDCSSLSALGENWEGSMYITSNQPLVAVSEWYQNAFSNPSFGPSYAAGYNAYSTP